VNRLDKDADLPDEGPGPDAGMQAAEDDEAQKLVLPAILGLFSGRKREIVELSYFQRLTSKEIATILHTTVAYVDKVLHEARELREVVNPPENRIPMNKENGWIRHAGQLLDNLRAWARKRSRRDASESGGGETPPAS
jgi:hypothetical protein